MKLYEDNLYAQWTQNTNQVLPNLLKRNLLVKPQDRPQTQQGDGEHPQTPSVAQLESQKDSDGKFQFS